MVVRWAYGCQARSVFFESKPYSSALASLVSGCYAVGMNWLEHPINALKGDHSFPIPDAVFLETRICDLEMDLESTGYRPFANKLERELQKAGLQFVKPSYYLADEWFCPDRSTAIAIPFWLAHPSLRLLEERMMKHVEGSTPRSFMQLLRHEAGHCVEHAYHLSRRADWRRVFGSADQIYNPDQYSWDKHSRDFVRHLPDGYAQSHPEEDFAETFAVWLDPRSRWRERYKNWDGALAKLRFVEALMNEVKDKKPRPRKVVMVAKTTRLKRTLSEYYRLRMKTVLKSQLSKH